MRKVYASIGVLAIVFAVLTGLEENVSADAAIVTNPGRDGQECRLAGLWNGVGDATLVKKDGETITFVCHGQLDQNENPPDKAERVYGATTDGMTCKVVITPSGNFSAICH